MQFRNVSSDTRIVAYGLQRPQSVDPDGVLDVADDAAESYACQPTIWKQVEAAPSAPALAPTPAPAPAPAAPTA